VISALIGTAFIGIGLAAWFLVSVLNQFQYGRLVSRLKEYDVAALIPTWTFFAPRPGTTDYRLIYRDRIVDEGESSWQALSVDPPGAWKFLWHPQKRLEKLITDCVLSLLPTYDPARLDHLLGVPYLVLLSMVETENRDFRTDERQFAILAIDHGDDGRSVDLVFISAPIVLPRPGGLA
jgi:hypothetical protein